MSSVTLVATRAPEQGVSETQRALLRLVALGHQNKQIAHELGVSEPAIKKRISCLLRHYAVPNRASLVRAAIQMGELDAHPG